MTPRGPARPLAPVPRYTLTRREAAASLGISLNHFERKVQPELKVVISGQLVLIPVAELERWVQRHAHPLLGGLEAVGPPIRPCRSVAEIVEAVRVFAESHPDDEWIEMWLRTDTAQTNTARNP